MVELVSCDWVMCVVFWYMYGFFFLVLVGWRRVLLFYCCGCFGLGVMLCCDVLGWSVYGWFCEWIGWFDCCCVLLLLVELVVLLVWECGNSGDRSVLDVFWLGVEFSWVCSV